MRQRRFSCLLVFAVLTAADCAARQPGAPLKPGFNLFSRDQDVQLGREAAAQVQRQVKIVQNQFLQDYIQRNLESTRRAVKAGVRIGMGSDAVYSMFGQNTRELGWLVKAGMTPAQAVAAATTTGLELGLV